MARQRFAGSPRACSRSHSQLSRKAIAAGLCLSGSAGIELGMRYTPVDSVGLYVPGGKAAYPSSVLMNAIPAWSRGWPAGDGCASP